MLLEKVKQLQIKHLIQITVCVLGIYLLRSKQAYQFIPLWRKDMDLSFYANNQFPAPDERLPSPVVSDIDGDGQMEIVFITSDWRLQITEFRRTEILSKRLPHPRVLYSCNIGNNDQSRLKERPVVMETGYLDTYVDNKERSQVIVIMYSSWRVQCYDNTLVLLWQRALLDVGPSLSQHAIYGMAVMVTPHKIHPNDRGLVIVGASLVHKGYAHGIDDDDTGDYPIKENADDNLESSTFNKFSTFALSGLNGTLKWQHVPHVMDTVTQMEEESHHWKLSLRRGSWSQSRNHWSRYGPYLLKHMPHQWLHLKDTKFELSDIHHLREDRKNSDPAASISPLDDLGTRHLIGMAFGGLHPHSHHEHISNPSAVVVHHDRGLELLSLFNGQLITQLALEERSAIYGDINRDGKLDQVMMKLGDTCQGEASTVHPHSRALYTGDICSRSWWSDQDEGITENKHQIVPPIIVKSVSRPRGLVNHLLGKTLPTERRGYDSIFITSTGYVSSFNQFGNANWQVQTSIKWSDKAKAADNPHYRYTPEGMVFHNAFTPSMLPYSLQMYGPQTHAVITGWNNIILLDLEDGYVAAEHSLPCQPIDPPVLADFDGNGWSDIIVYCPTGYIGMSIHSQPQYVYMIVLSITIILIMLLLSWCSQIEQSSSAGD